MKTVVVSTDASFCRQSGAAGWGVVIESGDKVYTYSGVVHGARSSVQAEALALTAGVTVAVRSAGLVRGDAIRIEADCEAAMDLMRRPAAASDSLESRLAADTHALLDRKGIRLLIQPVRAHSADRGDPALRNRSADALARAGMAIGRMQATA